MTVQTHAVTWLKLSSRNRARDPGRGKGGKQNMGGIAKAYVEGGMFMHFIMITSVFGLGVMIERFIFLFFRYKKISNELKERLEGVSS